MTFSPASRSPPASHSIVERLADLWELDVPPELQANLRRHHANLARLAGALRMAGIDSHQIETSVNEVAASYRHELINATDSMVKDC